ncbi:RNA polymerase, sigma-24 subunit, ECF subfamily [Catenulispora acidiphila DSM 44928]|uniref:RNA polymerase, sigma-24 subunit, ECF subfamily n=1 Tax=Catenulispora acidiphila (strain DSM 44928 / JCM 14897 / NBRC 102108 / NRRL B-24433 / ID139908) TaxID=479433 RepID=C7QJ80_CATAD|nr:SigE family RNA polymerase sigma factor [Catenulispora acidiphila]ACU69222.1 RNA polymerase, sigma-24 subunit, ECF subfamily [Catenulispora acidiphila DSM 44928]
MRGEKRDRDRDRDRDGNDRRGIEEAEFREYMVSRWGGLVRFAYGLTGDRGHAEDLAQTALAKAYASWSRVRRADDPDAYVRRILINANHRRFRKRRVDEHAGPGAAAREPVVTDGTAAFDQREALVAALMELPPKQRAVVVLRYWDGLTETQAATVLGCSVGTVKSQASRALAKLRTSTQLQDGKVIS